MDGTVIVRVKRNAFDGNTGYDAVTNFTDGSSCQTVVRVPEVWAQRELTEHKERACIERATDADLSAYEACVVAGSAGSAGKAKKK